MKILLLGRNGQVGWELQRSLSPIGNVIALGRNTLNNPNRLCGDLTDLGNLRLTIQTVKPDVIVNAAAYTAVDDAENDSYVADIINFQAPKIIAEEALKIDALLIHYSTDYVFDGTKVGYWVESDTPNPINQYGKSKLSGETAIQDSLCRHLIFRTSWVYGFRGSNFAKTILKLAKDKKTLKIIEDQIGSPTSAALIADCTAHAIVQTINHQNYEGLYHLVASGETTWFDYASFIIDYSKRLGCKLAVEHIIPITSSEYTTTAIRPLNSRLDTTKLTNNFGLYLPNWKQGVSHLLTEIHS